MLQQVKGNGRRGTMAAIGIQSRGLSPFILLNWVKPCSRWWICFCGNLVFPMFGLSKMFGALSLTCWPCCPPLSSASCSSSPSMTTIAMQLRYDTKYVKLGMSKNLGFQSRRKQSQQLRIPANCITWSRRWATPVAPWPCSTVSPMLKGIKFPQLWWSPLFSQYWKAWTCCRVSSPSFLRGYSWAHPGRESRTVGEWRRDRESARRGGKGRTNCCA